MTKAGDKINTLVWEEPPFAPAYDWLSIAKQAREKPMVWARVFEQDRVSVVNAIRQGSVGDVHPDLGFETKTANNRRYAPRLCDLWIRYNPDLEKDLRATIRSARKKN